MALVADEGPLAVRPAPPLLGEALQEEVGDRLAVVDEDPRLLVRASARAEQRRKVAAQVVAAPALELLEQGRRPVRLAEESSTS
jgi:hypothetical protein